MDYVEHRMGLDVITKVVPAEMMSGTRRRQRRLSCWTPRQENHVRGHRARSQGKENTL